MSYTHTHTHIYIQGFIQEKGPKTDLSQKLATLERTIQKNGDFKKDLHRNRRSQNGPFTKIRDLKMNSKLKTKMQYFILILPQTNVYYKMIKKFP